MEESRSKKKRRMKIIEVSEELFYQQSIAETSMKDIAERAGIGRSTLYEYFHRKEEILMMVRETYLEEIYDFDVGPIKHLSGYEAIEKVMTSYFERLIQRPKVVLFFMDFNRMDLPDDLAKDCGVNRMSYGMYQTIAEAIMKGISDQSIQVEEINERILVIDEVIFGTAMRFASKPFYRYDNNIVTKEHVVKMIPSLVRAIKK